MKAELKEALQALLIVAAAFATPILGYEIAGQFITPAPAHVQTTASDVAAAAVARSVMVATSSSVGTGFFVSSEGHIMTCAHVVGDAPVVVVMAPDGTGRFGEVLFVDKVRDLALIKISVHGMLFFRMAATEPKVGQHVWVVGTPFGNLPFSVNDGRVCAHRQGHPVARSLQLSATINRGTSGGPVLNDAGELVGVAEAVYTSGENDGFDTPVGFAVDISLVKEFLARFAGL